MSASIAFVDANVLFTKTLCDWLFMLRIETDGGMFALFSSEDSITEALYHLRKSKPTANGAFTAKRQELFRRSLDDIIDSFSGDVEFPGTDKHDHHIHAAALECHARYLIADDRGFGLIDPNDLPYEVHTTDSFLLLVAANAPSAVDGVILKQLKHFSAKSGTKPLDVVLENAGCPEFAECVRKHIRQLAEGAATHGIAHELLLTQT